MYLTIHNYFHKDQIRLKYSQTETVNNYDEIEHKYFKQCLKDFGIMGVEISSMADIPSELVLVAQVLLRLLYSIFFIHIKGNM